MAIRIGINGFGRIGRIVFRQAQKHDDIEVVAVNDLTDASMLAHLLKYDSVHGSLDGDVSAGDGTIEVGGKSVKVLSSPKPEELGWGDLGVDYVVESTGRFTDGDAARAHLKAGAKRVVISAPGKGNVDATFVLGVNDNEYDPAKHVVVSNASCTTNCLGPVAKVLHESFGIEHGLMTTIHAYTADQRIQDAPHKDMRRARAAALSMVPTSTGAAKAIGLVLPELNGKLDGFALRVPTPNVSIVDLTATLGKSATAESVNGALKAAAEGPLAGVLGYSELPLVSIDYNGCTLSSTVDALSTKLLGDNLVKVLAWYDNESGYSSRVVDLIKLMAKHDA